MILCAKQPRKLLETDQMFFYRRKAIETTGGVGLTSINTQNDDEIRSTNVLQPKHDGV